MKVPDILRIRCCSFTFFICVLHMRSLPNSACVPSVLCACVQCLVAGLDGCRDLLPSWSGLGGEPPGVPAGLLVHKPGVSSPNQQVEEAKHLEEQQNHPSLLVKKL